MRSMVEGAVAEGRPQLGGSIAPDAGRIVALPRGAIPIAELSLLKHLRRHFHRAVTANVVMPAQAGIQSRRT